MDDHEVLQHLLKLDAEAGALVNDAQAEADRRISGGEKQNRLLYEEAYARELESLESHYVQNIAAVREDYRKQLEVYRESLKTMSINTENFSSLAERLLIIREV